MSGPEIREKIRESAGLGIQSQPERRMHSRKTRGYLGPPSRWDPPRPA